MCSSFLLIFLSHNFFCYTLYYSKMYQISRFYSDLCQERFSAGLLVSLNGPVSYSRPSFSIHTPHNCDKPAMFVHGLMGEQEPGLVLQVY